MADETQTPADDFDTRLLEGVAETLAAEVTPSLEWHSDPEVAYDGGMPAIVLETYPEGVQDAVTLTGYVVADGIADGSDDVVGVQAMIRSRSRGQVRAIASGIFAVLQSRRGGSLGTVRLVSARRASGTNVGQDADGRLVRSENYYLTVHRPSTHRL